MLKPYVAWGFSIALVFMFCELWVSFLVMLLLIDYIVIGSRFCFIVILVTSFSIAVFRSKSWYLYFLSVSLSVTGPSVSCKENESYTKTSAKNYENCAKIFSELFKFFSFVFSFLTFPLYAKTTLSPLFLFRPAS